MSYTTHTENYKGFTIRIESDDTAECPYDSWDMLGTLYHWHKRGFIGTDLSRKDREEIQALIRDIENGGGVIVPVYLYEHSGQTINTTGFSCPWDSGKVGFWAVTGEEIRKEYSKKRISKKIRDRVQSLIRAQVEDIDNYLTGNVWGFIVERADGEHVDSCWSFYGDYKEVIKEAKSAADYAEKQDLPLLASGGLLGGGEKCAA